MSEKPVSTKHSYNKYVRSPGGICKNVISHMLCRSFATHLLEQGTDSRYIHESLGHNNLKTTQIYTYVKKREVDKNKNPMDNFFEENKNCKMIKEKYKQLCLSLQFSDVNTTEYSQALPDIGKVILYN